MLSHNALGSRGGGAVGSCQWSRRTGGAAGYQRGVGHGVLVRDVSLQVYLDRSQGRAEGATRVSKPDPRPRNSLRGPCCSLQVTLTPPCTGQPPPPSELARYLPSPPEHTWAQEHTSRGRRLSCQPVLSLPRGRFIQTLCAPPSPLHAPRAARTPNVSLQGGVRFLLCRTSVLPEGHESQQEPCNQRLSQG